MATFSNAFEKGRGRSMELPEAETIELDFVAELEVVDMEEPYLFQNSNRNPGSEKDQDPLANNTNQHGEIGAGSGTGAFEATDQTVQDLMEQVRHLQQQVAACLASQPLLYQVLDRCGTLERKMEAMKEEVDRALKGAMKAAPQPQTFRPTLAGSLGFPLRVASLPSTSTQTGKANPSRRIYPSRSNATDIRGRAGPAPPSSARPTPSAYKCRLCAPSTPSVFRDQEELADHYTSSHPAPNTNVDKQLEEEDEIAIVPTSPSPEGRRRRPKTVASLIPGPRVSQNVAARPTASKQSPWSRRHLQCDECKWKFASEKYLRIHKLNVHRRGGVGGPRVLLPCPECGTLLADKRVLKRHMRIHTGEKPYSCPYCFKRFRDQGNMRSHVYVHTGKPFKCAQCGRSFRGRYELTRHQCHPGTG